MNQSIPSARFTKRFPDSTTAAEVARRSTVARRAGVPTPKVIAINNHTTIDFEWIDGVCGIELLKATDLRELLSPLSKLHKMEQSKLSRFNPFLRIDPRVERLSVSPELLKEIQKLKQVELSINGVVHGDFHLGQLLYDTTGQCWVIDFDDMAIGPPEADLGNLIAYLSTHPVTMESSVLNSLIFWKHQVLGAWEGLGQNYEDEILHYYVKLAFLRRTLKRCEAGDYSLMHECVNTLLAFG